MLIDRFMPRFDVSELHQVDVRASAERTYPALRHVDLSRSPVTRALFAIRSVPALFAGHKAWLGPLTPDDAIRRGFVLLGEEPNIEFVLGVAGRFWRLGGELIPIDPASFEAFAEPGLAKATWNFHVEATGSSRCRVSTETRVLAMDQSARRRFRRYWRVIGPFSSLIRREMLRVVKADAEARPP